ncbi:MAG: hypothetical protein ACE5HS_21885 [bacterium]
MSEHASKSKDVVTLDVETNVLTAEGRVFLNKLNTVSRVLFLRDTKVDFKGAQILKTGYIGDFKCIEIYKCPNGFFLFGNRAFGNNNWSVIGKTLDELLDQIGDLEIKKKIEAEMAADSEKV